MSRPRFPAIPSAFGDMQSLTVAVQALKEAVEQMAGTRGAYSFSSITYGANPPVTPKMGDAWINTTLNNRMLVYTGTAWVRITV